MPGFPLLSIGAGLQGFMQGYNNAQALQQRRQALAQELKQQQQQQQSGGLAYQTLLNGGLGGGSGGVGGGQMMPFSPSAGGFAGPQPPMPGASSPPAAPPAPPPQTPGQFIRQSPAEMVQQNTLADPDANIGSPETGITRLTVTPPRTPQPTGQAPSAGPTEQQSGIDVSQFFNEVDPTQIAQAIQKARPGVDPAVAMDAVDRLYKIYHQGDSAQRALTAQTLKYLFPTANFTMAEQGRDARQQNTIAAQADRQATGISARQQMQTQRLSEQQYQSALRRADATQQRQLSELHKQIGELDRRVSAIQSGADPTSRANQQALDQILQQRQALTARENQMAQGLLGGTQQPQQ